MTIVIGFEGSANKIGIGIIRDGEVLSNPRRTYITPPGQGFLPSDTARHHRAVILTVLKEALEQAGLKPADIDCVAFTKDGGASMAKPLLKIQRYFRRKPIRFFSLILLYLTAGSLVFLHSGFVGESRSGARGGRDSLVASEKGGRTSLSDARGLGIMSRVFKETRRSGRRYGPPWMKKPGQEGQDTVRRGGDYTNNWNRALKARSAKDVDDGRGFSTQISNDPSPGYNIEQMAKKGSQYVELPYTVKGMDVSFSGITSYIEEAAHKMISSGQCSAEDLCFSLQETVFFHVQR
ncbi:probable tRNA N6-adenosine threonylcarbamoyltransferase [Notothenia coriiceps]|uniref:Probable tRNA N6-adenosine threonylcarbamoyltransferase n=1 Tax=Notothenia coriiceps TaxID=8208 RepID=A0A6I9N9Z0_9TELE|nr:PREDICTED: probable tRNA N6-adenosine threonylcarbamoyltransferase [Notothenia coriiceps]